VVSTLIDTYPTTFAVYEMHVSDAFSNTWGNQRAVFYGNLAGGIPWFAYDGLFDGWFCQSGGGQGISCYEPNLLQRQPTATDVTIELYGAETGSQTYDVTAHVCIEPGGVDKTMRVYMVHALDHWPATPTYSRNTVREGAATEDVTVAPGACVDVVRTFVFDATSWAQQSDIKIVAWAQTPATAYPAEVHQAKVMHWPFIPYTDIFADDFEDGTTDAWTEVLP
jgi:hypothetical protein